MTDPDLSRNWRLARVVRALRAVRCATPYSQWPTLSRCLIDADQDEERGLKGVLGVVVVAQDAAADAPDHRTVAAHQGSDRGLVALFEEACQELGVAERGLLLAQHDPAQVANDLADWCRHRAPFSAGGRARRLPIKCPQPRTCCTIFRCACRWCSATIPQDDNALGSALPAGFATKLTKTAR
jgi:hypothetical protein